MFAAMDQNGTMNHDSPADHSAMHDRAMTTDATKPVTSSVPILMASALDHHPIGADILKDTIRHSRIGSTEISVCESEPLSSKRFASAVASIPASIARLCYSRDNVTMRLLRNISTTYSLFCIK
jgi:hypothetical protein